MVINIHNLLDYWTKALCTTEVHKICKKMLYLTPGRKLSEKLNFMLYHEKNIRIIGNEIKSTYVVNTDLKKLQIDTFQYLLL
jgi:hypothetical protein